MDKTDKEDNLLLANLEDRAERCRNNCVLTCSEFLDMRQKALAQRQLRTGDVRWVFYGGYADAERAAVLFMPDYMELQGEDGGEKLAAILGEDNPLSVLRLSCRPGGRPLTHRDYLGALLSLGIRREVTGDILVRDNGADVLILRSMGDFLLSNFNRAGRTELTAELAQVDSLRQAEYRIEERSDTVASLRLDSLTASVFGLSRGKAAEAIRGGLVFVNSMEVCKPDALLAEGDKLVLRGKGKAVLKEIGGRSRKDRLFVKFARYL